MINLKTLRKLVTNRHSNFFEKKIVYLINTSPKDLKLYREAFTHTAQTSKISDYDFERLEFLGDAVLNSIVTHYLFNEKPGINEGELTKLRSKIVRRNKLNELGEKLNLVHYLVNYEKQNLGRNIAGNLFESLVGAIFLDQGYDKCDEFITGILREYICLDKLENTISSYKSFIHEWCQKKKIKLEFCTEEEENATNYTLFVCFLKMNDEVFVKGRAKSKKIAEEVASKRAYYALQNTINEEYEQTSSY